ncbi:NUDIX domain-containing protein [Colletotrichum graminicola]|uniref:NUDIX domain-containing protein n=1 Tax=Colletotrichum graminicola (strain M1.001 / M2 / FGSC 10212) TaxID=645133 RepID=E3Q412_COLGM|nr:NUDIX domain-containing protein [Colletotrichum graminicola M1.001]EFQ25764.1 NUDIX domain-containing protein [Colletotrichum graminicola M1.001]WDK10878.1 NUDIX domain-containing protein [Colletotrichum graminicola]
MGSTVQQAGEAPNPFAHTRVGVAAIIRREDGKIIVGRRKSSHGAGTIQLPGGHLEFGESFFTCAERETLEETGLRVRGTKVAGLTNDFFGDLGKHYITIFVRCELEDDKAEPMNMEPEKCAGWSWVTWGEIRAINEAAKEGGQGPKLFLPLQNLVEENPDFEASA